MVRNSELPEMGLVNMEVAAAIRSLVEARGLSQTEVGKIIGRAQSYASLRLKGMRSWTVEELDALAPELGFEDFFALMRQVRNHGGSYDDQTVFVPGIGEVPLMGLAAKMGDTETEQESMEEQP